MKIHYDTEADALYITLADDEVSRTVTIDEGTLVDLDRHGHPVGVEVVSPARPWPLEPILERFGSQVTDEDQRLLRQLHDQSATSPRRPSFMAPVQLAGA